MKLNYQGKKEVCFISTKTIKLLSMKSLYKISLLSILIICTSFIIPGERKDLDNFKWFKGNLHMHSFWSDGDTYPEQAIKWYKENNYNFVGLSDHNILANITKWKTIPNTVVQIEAFEKYLKNYGLDWVNYKKENGRIIVKLKTFEEYKEKFKSDSKFIILQSEEISDRYNNKPIHLNAINTGKLIKPQGGNSVVEVLQNNINVIEDSFSASGNNGLTIINHPNFGYAFSDTEMCQLDNARFFEVYNMHPSVNNSGDSLNINTEDMWDNINISYSNNNKPLLFGLATDDTHNYLQKGKQYAIPGRGWIMVKAKELDTESIIDAMNIGNFYASTGVSLKHINISRNKLSISIIEEEGVCYQTQFIGAFKNDKNTRILKTINGGNSNFKISKDLLFVRAKIISTKIRQNSITDNEFESAWIQPHKINIQ